MNSIILEKLIILKKHFNLLKNLKNNYNDSANHKNVLYLESKNYKIICNIITCFNHWLDINEKIKYAKDMLKDIEMFDIAQDELKILQIDHNRIEEKLETLSLPNDPNDKYGCFIELRAGTGGKEAAIFVGELFRMYVRYAEIKNWTVKIINATYGECGGYKEIISKISCNKSYSKLKFESGGHRVQRVPHTESQGRIHTSTCTVAIIPIIPNIETPKINVQDLKIDTFRASGAGGQHVNTTDSAIRITHIPTRLVVECQDERSQHKNKSRALSTLQARLYALNIKRRHQEMSNTRRNLLGTGDRSDRIRTYNFPQGRITDHRVPFTSYKLHDILNGDLDILIQPIVRKHQENYIDQILFLNNL